MKHVLIVLYLIASIQYGYLATEFDKARKLDFTFPFYIMLSLAWPISGWVIPSILNENLEKKK